MPHTVKRGNNDIITITNNRSWQQATVPFPCWFATGTCNKRFGSDHRHSVESILGQGPDQQNTASVHPHNWKITRSFFPATWSHLITAFCIRLFGLVIARWLQACPAMARRLPAWLTSHLPSLAVGGRPPCYHPVATIASFTSQNWPKFIILWGIRPIKPP